MEENPTEEHFLQNHRTYECSKRDATDRTFYRPDHLRQHIRNFHGATLCDIVQARWKTTATVTEIQTLKVAHEQRAFTVAEQETFKVYKKGRIYGHRLETWDKRESSEPDSIAAQCAKVVQGLDTLITRITIGQLTFSEINQTGMLDEKDRFLIWAVNIGAMHGAQSPASLEQRLSEAPQIREHIVRILKRLEDSIVKATSIVAGSIPNRTYSLEEGQDVEGIEALEISDDDLSSVTDTDSISDRHEHPISEVAELRRAIKDTITNLFRMSVVIRNPTPRGRYKSSRNQEPIDPAFDITHVRDKFPTLSDNYDDLLIRHLGKANTRRREYFRYRREHHLKLLHDQAQPMPESSEGNIAEPNELASSFKATTFKGPDTMELPDELEDRDFDVGSITSFATTAPGGSGNFRRIPDPPKRGIETDFHYGSYFECPYCYTIQNVANRREWNPFADVEEFERHLRHDHPISYTAEQLPGILSLSQFTLDKFAPSSCIFCDDWTLPRLPDKPVTSPVYATAEQFMKHLGKHLVQLALFSLPGIELTDESDDDPEEIKSDGAFSPVVYADPLRPTYTMREAILSSVEMLELDVYQAEIAIKDTKEGTKEHASAEKQSKKAKKAIKISNWKLALHDVEQDLKGDNDERTQRALIDKKNGLEAKLTFKDKRK
ncbi:uncharacterized protein N0V89_006537 [Didymosphaeria variabile]|uniref:Oxidoreductase acuF-like C2H2 type zinc-finger domain-containing protein n=1 Tax=Didymosphaeria variabile TaxID=1932322 RepID=A0A9W8XJ97_9PLEO|nr:uncharacterized protein N0V89_006537 [Didymosphaeria variabile]KAJ4351198.1 hypothetical protein N0V89_006537 [Didymosphaeria variabile]